MKKVNGESVIKLESGNDLIVKNKGRQYHDSEVVNIPKQTITHNKSINQIVIKQLIVLKKLMMI